jgi:thiamine pyrophosphokinase
VFAAAPVEPSPRLRKRLADLRQPYVVAADGGAATALVFGYQPDVVVGDLDSIDAASLGELRRRGVPIETHPRDKNATDGQLAIQCALEQQPDRLLLVGFLGGPRLDQALASVLLLIRIETPASLLDGRNEAWLVRPGVECVWPPEPDEIVSLIPIAGDVDGVRTHGLRWPLRDEPLTLGDSRGVSNEPAAAQAAISVRRGLLLVTRHFPSMAGL